MVSVCLKKVVHDEIKKGVVYGSLDLFGISGAPELEVEGKRGNEDQSNGTIQCLDFFTEARYYIYTYTSELGTVTTD